MIKKNEGLPGDPVTKTSLRMQGAWMQSLVSELDLT